ncbi:MAG: cytochrome c-type biogenesis protein CcmH [candidate division NC10 bacterium]|nr:cytochrome c-type biogenesis protein CcmH [candidate division NC10 bacterium]
MQFRVKFYPVLLLVLFWGTMNPLAPLARAQGLTVSDVAKDLACLCGCGLTVESCTHGNCGFAEPAKARIKQMIAQGRTKEEIIQVFVSQYGERAMAAPTKKGFNLSAWVTPFLAIFVGATLIYFLVQAWVRRREEFLLREQRRMARPEMEAKYQEKLEKELKSFD